MAENRYSDCWLTGSAAAVMCVAMFMGCGEPDGSTADSFGFVDFDAGDSRVEDTSRRDTSRFDTDIRSSGAPTGAACDGSTECAGNTCLTTPTYSDGYCTDRGCQTGGCAGSRGACVDLADGASGCFARCDSDDECREGYECESAETGALRICTPDDESDRFRKTRRMLDVQCDPEHEGRDGDEQLYRFEFELGPEARSFLMVPFVTSGTLRPLELETPRRTVDLRDDYIHHNSRVSDAYNTGDLTGMGTFGHISFDWPIGVPYAPKFDRYVVQEGSYKLRVEADEADPCLYVLEKQSGSELDVNFYFVGADGLSAETAESDADFQEAVQWMERLLEKADVELGTTRYFDLAADVEDRFQVVDGRNEANRLMAYGKPPTDTLSGHLSVDVFLVETLQVESPSGQSVNVLGMSAGIPGAAGMHGNVRNGLVFQTADLGFANRHVGLVMAHEIGHFLGLRHTTEIFFGTDRAQRLADLFGAKDPIGDTEVCQNISEKVQANPARCADFGNLMFPVAPPPDQTQDAELTSDQSTVLRANPLITDR